MHPRSVRASIALLLACSAAALPAVALAAPLTPDAHLTLQRVLRARDNHDAPFIVIDKRQAQLWVFDRRGRALGSTPVLLGYARGDHTVPGIGDRPLAQVQPEERTTPAGRFVAEPGVNTKGEDVIWVDYDSAVSMHRVRANVPAERRLQRLGSPTPDDNRISYGCINVPARFYERMLQPLLQGPRPVVYLLPETRPVTSLFTQAR